MKSETTPVQKMLNVWAISVILWSLYRIYFQTELPMWFDEFIAKPLIFLVPLHYFITRIEKKSFLKSVDLKTKNWRSALLFGCIAGVIFLGTGLVMTGLRNGGLGALVAVQTPMMILYYILIALATSVSEEILSRGFVLKRLYSDSKNMYTAVLYSSLLFFVLHIPILFTNPDLHGVLLLQVMVTDILLSVAVSFLYLQKKSLLVPIIIHACYILSLYLFL